MHPLSQRVFAGHRDRQEIQCGRLHDVSEKAYVAVRHFVLRNLGASSNRTRWGLRAGRRCDRRYGSGTPGVALRPTHRKHRHAANWEHRSASDGQHDCASDRLRTSLDCSGLESNQSQSVAAVNFAIDDQSAHSES
jgi:hypothetical protein